MNKIYLFAISHYCEKGRWALDYFGIDYEPVYLAPGMHLAWAKKNGLESSGLPVVESNGQLIQGSSKIIDWAESVSDTGKTLVTADNRDEVLAMEQRLDDVSGVHTRRMLYAHTITKDPKRIRDNFLRDLQGSDALKLKLTWPVVRRIMIKKMDIGDAQGQESKAIVEQELTWLNQQLEGGRRFLVGDSFTRADLTMSALYSRFAAPEQHPFASHMATPPGLEDFYKKWRQEPVIQRIVDNYREFRLPTQ